MKTIFKQSIFIKIIFLLMCYSLINFNITYADETATFTTSVTPNVLIILDNSNSMDQDFYGNAVTSWRSQSRSVQARKAIIDLIVNPYYDQLRIGLMSYRVGSASKYHLHYSNYFTSFNPASYCPLGDSDDDKACLQACENYCKTGSGESACDSCCKARNSSFDAVTALTLDDMFSSPTNTYYPAGSEQRNRYCKLVFPRTQRIQNPTDTSNYIYHKTPGTFYSSSNYGNAFCYAQTYSAAEGTPPSYTSDSYTCRTTKTGTSDGFVGYGSTSKYNGSFQPTDEDLALGFLGEFGRRNYWMYSGQTWFKNSSPGGGYLHLSCQTGTTTHRDNLLAKLNPYENNESGYMSCSSTSNVENCPYIVNAGLTPTAGTLQTAIDYFKGSSSPIQYWCQNNFIIYVTDGLPSVAENGTKGTAETLMPAVINKIKALRTLQKKVGGKDKTFDIKTYIVGVGMTDTAKDYLDQMAIEGGTSVDGKAFYADNPDQLRNAIQTIVADILENTYNFSKTAVATMRTSSEDHIFIAYLEPKSGKPFWPGRLRRFTLNSDGSLPEMHDWDALNVLITTPASSRNIKTYLGSGLVDFTTSNITKNHLEVATDTDRDALVGYIRGETSYKPDGIKLGDIFHSNPALVGTPNLYFNDPVGSPQAFKDHANAKVRTGDDKIILVGANDGQLHAFGAGTGIEKWSFIPPNLLKKIKYLKDGSLHHYYVDGQITAADIWLGTGSGVTKTASQWKTIAVVGLGKGVSGQGDCVTNCNSCLSTDFCYKYNVCAMSSTTCKDQKDRCVSPSYLWAKSSDPSQTSHTYGGDYTKYAGFYALDINNTSSPNFMWILSPSASDAPYFGEPWGRMSIGRVKVGGNEVWVGFIGAGFNPKGSTDTRGKGFFVVRLSDGTIIKSFVGSQFTHSIPGSPAIIDYDKDGFVDYAYIGDLQGNVWRFNVKADSTGNWTVTKLFDATGGGEGARPIYGKIEVTTDPQGNWWVYWVTGDKADPLNSPTNDRLYGVKEDFTTTFTSSNLQNITSASQSCDDLSKKGWYFNFTGSEKSMSDVVITGGVIFFTTFLPPSSCSDPCSIGGESKLYAINYLTCRGEWANNERSISLGGGLAPSPVVSKKEGYIDSSGSPVPSSIRVFVGDQSVSPPISMTQKPDGKLKYWRDLRVN